MGKNCLLYRIAFRAFAVAMAASIALSPFVSFAKENTDAVNVESTIEKAEDTEVEQDGDEYNEDESILQATYSYVVGDQNFERMPKEEEVSVIEPQTIPDEEVARDATFDTKKNDFELLLLIILASISSLAAVEIARRRIKNKV